jgi:glycerophosphoryl diester phosphodiesterase
MNGSGRTNFSKKILILVIVLIVLCIAAVVYIFALVGGRNDSGWEDAADSSTDVSEELTGAAEDIRSDADEAIESAGSASTQGSSHIYSYSGTADIERFTSDAYDGAIEAGAGCIVIEMVVSASGTPYAADDDYAFDMTGVKGYFSGMSDGQIDGLKTRGGRDILKLSDIFNKYGESVSYVVAVNYASARNINAFIDIVREFGYEDIITVQCPYLDMLEKIEGSFPDMPKIYRCQDQAGFNSAKNASYADILSVDKSLMTEDNIKAAHDSGKQFNVRTINSEEDIRAAVKLGVDSYFTDETALAVKLEQE